MTDGWSAEAVSIEAVGSTQSVLSGLRRLLSGVSESAGLQAEASATPNGTENGGRMGYDGALKSAVGSVGRAEEAAREAGDSEDPPDADALRIADSILASVGEPADGR